MADFGILIGFGEDAGSVMVSLKLNGEQLVHREIFWGDTAAAWMLWTLLGVELGAA